MPYIGVDFDGTVAAEGTIAPLQPMIDRIKRVRSEGVEVRIITARAQVQSVADDRSTQQTVGPSFDHAQVALVRAWCLEHLGELLTVQFWKDYDMIELWDDRAFHVLRNVGEML